MSATRTSLLSLLFIAFSIMLQDAILSAGTRLDVRLDRTVSSRTSNVGDTVACSLASDLLVDGRILAHSGHPLRARVTYVA